MGLLNQNWILNYPEACILDFESEILIFFTILFFRSMRNYDFRDTNHTSECLFEICRLINFWFFIFNP